MSEGKERSGKKYRATLNEIKPIKPGQVIQEQETVSPPKPWPGPPMDLLKPISSEPRPGRPNNATKKPPKKD